MSDFAKPIRFICTYPGAMTATDDAILQAHRKLVGHGNLDPTPEQIAHQNQVTFVRPYRGVVEFTCPACGIRWRRE